jgi:hypothetical protein
MCRLVPEIVERVKARMDGPGQFDMLVEVVIKERTIKELAQVLKIPYGTAYQRVFRLRQRLREEGQALLGDTSGDAHDD